MSRKLKKDILHMISEFARLMEQLSAFEKRPFLLVADTFEEVQYRGRNHVLQLYSLLQQAQKKYSALRVVLAGRAPVTEIKTQELELGNLDSEAAHAFLLRYGINDRQLAEIIISKVGANPLTLKLAAELVGKYGRQELFAESLAQKKYYLFEKRLPEIQVQGILYRRILNHIHNPKVHKLAHPGLVLREITPDLIVKVLAVPCKLDFERPGEADFLFTEMSKEVSLVTRIGPDTLRHRPDVRKVMLQLIRNDSPEIVNAIHKKAVSYYSKREGIAERAEELYHRLCLNQSTQYMDRRWRDGIQQYLLGSMDELPPRAQAFLSARTGIEAADLSIWDSADIKDTERRTVRLAASYLNSRRPEKVLEVIDAVGKKEEPTKNGALALLKVRALIQLRRNDEAEFFASSTLNSFYADALEPSISAELNQYVAMIREQEHFGKPGSKGGDDDHDFKSPGSFSLSL